jgi:cell division septation protein DedD
VEIIYQGEHSGVSVAVDGSTYSFPREVPVDVPAPVARKLVEGNPSTWRTADSDPEPKPKKAEKADKAAPSSKEA